jgi:hypothetical protein
MNNLNKLALGVGFTAGGWIKSITPHSFQIHMMVMNVLKFPTYRYPRNEGESITPLFIGGFVQN